MEANVNGNASAGMYLFFFCLVFLSSAAVTVNGEASVDGVVLGLGRNRRSTRDKGNTKDQQKSYIKCDDGTNPKFDNIEDVIIVIKIPFPTPEESDKSPAAEDIVKQDKAPIYVP